MSKTHPTSYNALAVPHASCSVPLLRGWATSDRMEAPIVTEHLIMQMQALQREEGIDAVGPDTACFNLVISAWLRSKDVAAEKMIRQGGRLGAPVFEIARGALQSFRRSLQSGLDDLSSASSPAGGAI